MRALQIGTLLVGLGVCASARANTFFIDYQDRAVVDPLLDFETDCLGASEAEDCPARAAAMQAELVEILSALDGRGDEETIQVFSKAVNSGDPHLQEIGVRYMERRPSVPTGLWDKIKSFFFGENPGLGQASAEVLMASSDQTEQQLAELFSEARPADSYYTGGLPNGKGESDPWAQAAARDRQIEALFSFHEQELFTPAARLLMADHSVVDFKDPMHSLPVTGFVTDASVADVKAHFARVFGKAPFPSVKASEAKLQALMTELTELQPKLASGDQAAIKRVGELSNELAAVQQSALLAGLLNFEGLHCEEHEFWVDGDTDDLYENPMPRAVAVGAEPLLGRTVIRYFGGGGESGPVPGGDGPDGGTGDADGGVGDDGGKGGGSPPGKKGSGGCSTLPYGQGGAGLWLLAVLGASLAYQRRNRR